MAPDWHGTSDERRELADATDHNCACEFGLMGIMVRRCGIHVAVFADQRFLDGLVFMRRMRDRLLAEEDRA